MSHVISRLGIELLVLADDVRITFTWETHWFIVCDSFTTTYTHFTHKSKNCTHKMHNASHLKHCIQNKTNTSQKQTFANAFAIILIMLDLCVLHGELCVVVWKKCFMKVKTEIERWISVWFCRFAVCFCYLSVRFQKLCDKEKFVCKQLKKNL